MIWDFFNKTEPTPTGVAIVILERRFRNFSSDDLNRAMERAWRQRYDPRTFHASAGKEPHSAVLKAFGETFRLTHSGTPLKLKAYGKGIELPSWAAHRCYSTLAYECNQGSDASERKKMYCVLGLLCNELSDDDTVGFFFPAEHIFARHSFAVHEKFGSGAPIDAYELGKPALRRTTAH